MVLFLKSYHTYPGNLKFEICMLLLGNGNILKLSRRAAENRAVILGARRERELLVEELRRRLTPF